MSSSGTVIFVDDDDDIRQAYRQTLELEGFAVEDFDSAAAALEQISRDMHAVVLTDIRMPQMDGLTLFGNIREIDPDLPVILVTAHGDITTAVQAIRDGAHDFIEKPADPAHLVEIARRGLEMRRLVLENRALRLAMSNHGGLADRIIGNSVPIENLRATISQLATAEVDTLISGETGTGKELVARCIFEFGPRKGKNFVALNCAALPESIIESELFGHEKGAFTGALARRIGKIEHANGGIVFLDEIESMPLHLQAKLLRVLQERSLERVGGNQEIPVDIQVLAASKSDLRLACNEGRFREDLYYRLNVATIHFPPLRDRREDVAHLFTYFVQQFATRKVKPVPKISQSTLTILAAHSWPGNVRELKNNAERHVIGMPIEWLTQAENSSVSGKHQSIADQLDSFEKMIIVAALDHSKGRVSKAAESLKLPRKTLYLRMRKYGLVKEPFRE